MLVQQLLEISRLVDKFTVDFLTYGWEMNGVKRVEESALLFKYGIN